MKAEYLLEWTIQEFMKLQDPNYAKGAEYCGFSRKEIRAKRALLLEGTRQMVVFAVDIGFFSDLPNAEQYAQIREYGRERFKSALLDQKINPHDQDANDNVEVALGIWVAGKLLGINLATNTGINSWLSEVMNNFHSEDQEYAAICRDVRGAYAQVKRLTQTLKNGPGL